MDHLDEKIKKLQIKKLILEIADQERLNQWHYKSRSFWRLSGWPYIVPAAVQLISIGIAGWIYFRSDYYENVREYADYKERKATDSLTAMRKTINYEIIKAKATFDLLSQQNYDKAKKIEEIKEQVECYEDDKISLISSATKLENDINTLTNEKSKLLSQKTKLLMDNSKLADEKFDLEIDRDFLEFLVEKGEEDLDFAHLSEKLAIFKQHPNPYQLQSSELIKYIQGNGKFTNRIIDSLHSYCMSKRLVMASLTVLYSGTENVVYKNEYKKTLPIFLDDHKGSFLGEYIMNTITFNEWDVVDKREISKILMVQCQKDTSQALREDLFYCISRFAHNDSAFSLIDVGYSHYWDYLKYNRDMLMMGKCHNPKQTLMNIATFSPQLFLSIVVYFSDKNVKHSSNIDNTILLSIAGGFLDVFNYLPQSRFNEIEDLMLNLRSISKDGNVTYRQFRPKIDTWLHGDFERFRINKNELDKCVKERIF